MSGHAHASGWRLSLVDNAKVWVCSQVWVFQVIFVQTGFITGFGHVFASHVWVHFKHLDEIGGKVLSLTTWHLVLLRH